MTMTHGIRKLMLTTHIITSVGWLGATAADLALAVASQTSQDAQMMGAAYMLVARYALVPLSLASLLTGLFLSLGTPWGLFRHYWVFFKIPISITVITLLLLHMLKIAHVQIQPTVQAGVAVLLLLVATTLSVYKPRGIIPRGWRNVQVLGTIIVIFVLLFGSLQFAGGGEQGRGRRMPSGETDNQTPPIEHTPSEGRSGHTAPEDGRRR